MRDYQQWMTNNAAEDEELVFDMCEISCVSINHSVQQYEVIINDANEWQKDVNIIVLIKKSISAIKTGDVLTYQGRNFIIHFDIEDRGFYVSAKAKLCLSSLKWLNEDGYVKEAHFTISSTSSTNYGIDNGQIISLGKERRNIIVQSNTDTSKFRKTKRFIFSNRAWSVNSIDDLSDGLLYITLEEDLIDPAKDNVNDRIADYYGNVANFSITILNGEHFSIRAGTTIPLIAEVRNNGSVVQKDIEWFVSDELIAAIDKSGILSAIANGEVVVTARLVVDQSVLDTTVVTVELDNTNNFSVGIAETPTVITGTSKIFNAVVKNNNIIDPNKTVLWYLYAEDGVSPATIATMPFDSTTQCEINGTGIGIVKLQVVLIGTANISATIPIQIKSLI